MKGSNTDNLEKKLVPNLILLLHKTHKGTRMYLPNHPTLLRYKEDLFKSFDKFLEDYDRLKIEFIESEIFYGDHCVYRDKEQSRGFPLMLFSDGIRNICFEKGLTYSEMDSFLDALKTNAIFPQEERDIVSLFWERDFVNIKYFAVEEIPDQETEYVDKTLEAMETAEFATDSIELDEREITESSEQARFEPLLEMKTYGQHEIDGLMETIQQAKTFDAKRELVAIIFEILRLEKDANANYPVLHVLDYYVDELLTKSEFALVSRVAESLRELVEFQKRSSSHIIERTEQSMRRLSKRQTLERFQMGLNKNIQYELESIREFISMLGEEAIIPLCDMLDNIENPQARAMVLTGLEKLSRDHVQILACHLIDSSWEMAKAIVSLLGKLGGDEALKALRTCLHHDSKVVRSEAVRALKRIGGPDANELLLDFLTDQEGEIRTQVALSLDRIDNCEPVLKLVQSRSFRKRGLREKKALLDLLARSTSEQLIQILEKLLRKRSWLQPQSTTETRVAAASALGTLAIPRALNLLDEFSRDHAQAVRKACISSLQKSKSK